MSVSGSKLFVRIGENVFSNRGIRLNIKTEKISIQGVLKFTDFTPLSYDIMGPFRYIPFMQCRHRVYSMAHGIQGHLLINGSEMNFNRGLGYVEGDRGTEFPSDYIWTQCSWYGPGMNSVMISAANVRIGNYTFPGCIGIVYYKGKEYRLATYLGVKIKRYGRGQLWVQQGKYELRIRVIENSENTLMAPVKGKMERTVYECVNAKIRYQFIKDGIVLFDYVGRGCFEKGLK